MYDRTYLDGLFRLDRQAWLTYWVAQNRSAIAEVAEAPNTERARAFHAQHLTENLTQQLPSGFTATVVLTSDWVRIQFADSVTGKSAGSYLLGAKTRMISTGLDVTLHMPKYRFPYAPYDPSK